MTFSWTEERVAILKREWAADVRVILIADQLGGGCTKGAIIGKARRLGLGAHAGSNHAAERRAQRHERERKPRARKPPAPFLLKSPAIAMDDMQPVNDQDIPQEQRKTLLELGPDDCRFPCGDPGTPEFFFCGGPTWPNSPYCWGHHCIAYQPASDRPRKVYAPPMRAA